MHPSLFILSQLNTLRTRNEELAHRNESLTRRVKEKEAELAALSSLQVTPLQKRKSETEESLRTSPPSERSSNTAGSGNGDTLAPLRPGASLRAGNPGPSMTSSWSADGAFVGLRSSTSQRGSIGGPMTKNRLSGSGGTLVRKSFAQRADTRLVAEEVGDEHGVPERGEGVGAPPQKEVVRADGRVNHDDPRPRTSAGPAAALGPNESGVERRVAIRRRDRLGEELASAVQK